MRNDKHLAIKLRKEGKSYNEISQEVGIPKSTLCYWFRDLRWSRVIKKELTKKAIQKATKQIRVMARANKEKWRKWRKMHREKAKKEFKFLKSNHLFIAGVNLYWGEGDTVLKNGIVRLANTDYRMIIVFYRFLKAICKVPKEKVNLWLLLYPDIAEDKCKKFWSSKTKIPLSQFRKSQVIQGRHQKKRLKNGVCTIQVYSRGLKEKIMVWIDLFSKNYARV